MHLHLTRRKPRFVLDRDAARVWPMHGTLFDYRPPAGSLEPAADASGEATSDE